MSDSTQSEQRIIALARRERALRALDRAVLAYREDPTPANRAAVLQLQREHADNFYRSMTNEYIERTR